MALTHLLFVATVALLSVSFFLGSEAGELGVCYGMLSSHLMQPPAVVQLLKKNGITRVRLYDGNAEALTALANSGIKVGVMVPNHNLTQAAASPSYALEWVKRNVMAYPGTVIDTVDVGNEVFYQAPELTPQLLPAMKNIQAALVSMGLAHAVKVMTPIALDALKVPSWPPSAGEFRDDLAQSVMGPMIDFLDQAGSHLAFNIFPYFAYRDNPHTVDLDFALFRPNNGHVDSVTGLTYFNMFDAMLDAVFHAEEKLRNSRRGQQSSRSRRRMIENSSGSSAEVHESAPGPVKTGAGGSSATNGTVAGQKSVAAAGWDGQTYASNLISKVLGGTGTPYRPKVVINVHLFSLFNEDLKTDGHEDERHLGIFNDDGTPVYNLNFGGPGPGGASWCVANPAAGDTSLQKALDFACGNGGTNCSPIKPGGRCFDPDTVVAHASYAFNDYYQRNGRTDQSCDFGGCGSVVHQQPKFGNCAL